MGWSPTDGVSIGLACVYQEHRSITAHRLVRQFLTDFPSGDVTLWARTNFVEPLADWTVGAGPGSRTSDLRRLVDLNRATEWIVIADDDAWLSRGTFQTLIQRARETDAILAQPAHAPKWSHFAHEVTVAKGDYGVRKIGFVEIGPILAAHKSVAGRLFPEGCGPAGWGLEWYWATELGLKDRMAIVDEVHMVHPNPLGGMPSDDDLNFLRLMREQHGHDFKIPEA